MSLLLIALSLLRPLGVGEALIALAIADRAADPHVPAAAAAPTRCRASSALWRTFVLLIFAFIAGDCSSSLLVLLGALLKRRPARR